MSVADYGRVHATLAKVVQSFSSLWVAFIPFIPMQTSQSLDYFPRTFRLSFPHPSASETANSPPKIKNTPHSG